MADTCFPITDDWLARDVLRTWVKEAARSGDFIKTGFFLTDGGSLNASLSAGSGIVGGCYVARDTSSTLALTASSTNHIFIGPDETALDTLTITVNTTGTPPATAYVKLGTVVTGAGSITTINNMRNQPSSRVYDYVHADGVRQTGELISEGFIMPRASNASGNSVVGCFPGFAAFNAHSATPTAKQIVALTGIDLNTNLVNVQSLGRGMKLHIKGRYTAIADASIDALYERFGLGLVSGANTLSTASVLNFGALLETSRDDLATIGVIVDSSENIQSYRCAAAGDASYTDSTYNADLSQGMEFEVIVECPQAGNTVDDLLVTMKVRDNTGTMRTIHNGVQSLDTAVSNDVMVIVLVNQNAILDKLCYKVTAV